LNIPRILIGPLFNPGVIGSYLHHPQIKVFMSGTQATIDPRYDTYYDIEKDTLSDLFKRLPSDWQPEYLIWWDAVYQAIPPGIQEIGIPTLLIPGDWNLQLSGLWKYFLLFDHILADRALYEILDSQGITNLHLWPGFSFEPQKHRRLTDVDKVYDLVFIGNINHYVQRERGFYLERIGALSDKYRVLIASGVFGEDYTRLLNQAKIVFNYTICRTMNMRAYEAPACGALLMIEKDNLEVRDYFEDEVSCVFYDAQNLEQKIEYYLRHEEERARIAEAGYLKIQAHSYEKQFEDLLSLLPRLSKKRQGRAPATPFEIKCIETRQIFQSNTPRSPERAIHEILVLPNVSAEVLNQKGVFLISGIHSGTASSAVQVQAELHAQVDMGQIFLLEALKLAAENPVIRWNLGWSYELLGKKEQALVDYSQALEWVEKSSVLDWCETLPVLPERYTHFEVEWESAFRQLKSSKHPSGQEIRSLLSWMLLLRLAMLQTDSHERLHYLIRALIKRPDLGDVPFLLGKLWKDLKYPKRALSAFQISKNNQAYFVSAWIETLQLLIEMREIEKAKAFNLRCLPLLKAHHKLALSFQTFSETFLLLEIIELMQQGFSADRLASILLRLKKIQSLLMIQQFLNWALLAISAINPIWEPFFVTVSFQWSANLPENPPDLEPILSLSEGAVAGIFVGEVLNPPHFIKRVYDFDEYPSQGCLNLVDFPALFPPKFETDLIIEGLSDFNLLVGISANETRLERAFYKLLCEFVLKHQDIRLILWCTSALQAEQLEFLEAVFAELPEEAILFFPEMHEHEKVALLFESCQAFTGCFYSELNGYYQWALHKGIPLWLAIHPQEMKRNFSEDGLPALTPIQKLSDLEIAYDNYATQVDFLLQLNQTWSAKAEQVQAKRLLAAWNLRLNWIEAQFLGLK